MKSVLFVNANFGFSENLILVLLLLNFRKNKRKDKTANTCTLVDSSQDLADIPEPHNDENTEDPHPGVIYMTARHDEVIIRNISCPGQEEMANNSIMMVDNELYSGLNDDNDDTLMIDNELYASQLKTNDQAIMIENEIYAT